MMKALEAFGYVMGLSRNGSVVHEVKDVYANFSAPSLHVSLLLIWRWSYVSSRLSGNTRLLFRYPLEVGL
ncbi:MAG: hypothetical protein ACJAU0_000540 [Flavobacteriales bacterium]|jgi:hypothetical protein